MVTVSARDTYGISRLLVLYVTLKVCTEISSVLLPFPIHVSILYLCTYIHNCIHVRMYKYQERIESYGQGQASNPRTCP